MQVERTAVLDREAPPAREADKPRFRAPMPGVRGARPGPVALLDGLEKLHRFARSHRDEQLHPGVLDAAVLCAGSLVRARLIRLHPEASGPSRDRVHLASELWNPEVVHDVCRFETNDQRLAGRYVNLVCGDGPEGYLASHHHW